MIKRPFFGFINQRLPYAILESEPRDPVSIPLPSNLILLFDNPIDNQKPCLIKKKARVKKGEKLSLYSDSPGYIVSPAAGTIRTIEPYTDDSGKNLSYAVIETQPNPATDLDGQVYGLKETLESADAYLRALPGAPPLKTLAIRGQEIHTLVITGADTDLLSLTQQYVAAAFMKEIKEGIQILRQITGISKIFFTIPKHFNINADIETAKVIRTGPMYPSNLPAMVLKDHMNIVLPAGKTPQDMGICFITAEAVVSLARAYGTGKACHEKILTVIDKNGGSRRVRATLGTPLKRIFNALNLHVHSQDRIIIGGPMTGIATFSAYHPVQPDTDIVILQDKDMISQQSDNACVNCGKCIRACPADVPVNILIRYLAAGLYEDAKDSHDLFSCVDCGLCSYVCTARIPVFQYIRMGKQAFSNIGSEAFSGDCQ